MFFDNLVFFGVALIRGGVVRLLISDANPDSESESGSNKIHFDLSTGRGKPCREVTK